MPRLPRKRTGQSWADVEWNAMVDFLQSLTPRQTAGVLTDWTSDGVFRKAIGGRPGGGQPIDVQVLTFSSWGYGGDNGYITCSGKKVKLPPLLSFSQPSTRTVRGTLITYSSYDGSNQARTATVGTTAITQYVTPAYNSGDTIYAITVNGELVDMNIDGRKFCGPSS